MIDTDKYMEDVEEKYNLIMNLMDDEEREFEIKTRIRERNKIMVAVDKLDTEVKRLREENDKIRELLLRGVKLMNNASKTTDEGNDYFAESFEDAVMEVIE